MVDNLSHYVKLNVGGRLFYTTIATLTKYDTMLKAITNGNMKTLTDSEGWILIDRSGLRFDMILNYLRDGNISLPESVKEIQELLAEAEFYCIDGLINLCNETLSKYNELKSICCIPLITSQDEEDEIITNSNKPLIRFLINRHNNVYSYTSSSDYNLLKNIELFDRLAFSFNDKIKFIKNVIGNDNVCSWSYYAGGKKIGEISCTTIVYTSDRKHIRIEYPEAKIYSEILLLLMYENGSNVGEDLVRRRLEMYRNS